VAWGSQQSVVLLCLLQRAEWDNERLPALVDHVSECKAAKVAHVAESAQRDVELREEIVFRYEQLEVSKREAEEAGVERRRADQEDQVAHATVELQFKQAHDARLQVLAGEEVELREAHALDVTAMNRELDEFRVQVPALNGSAQAKDTTPASGFFQSPGWSPELCSRTARELLANWIPDP